MKIEIKAYDNMQYHLITRKLDEFEIGSRGVKKMPLGQIVEKERVDTLEFIYLT